jgi:predicted  nucleic acid-binding Zn-ribbon protein
MKQLKVVLFSVAVVLLAASCAAKRPQADVDAANAAFAAAATVKADVYAADSFKAASDANDALTANLNAKEYGKTAALAKTLLDASNKASADANTAIEAVKGEVATLTTDVNALLPVVQEELASAVKAGKKAKVDVKSIKATVDAVAQTLTDAQASTDYADAKAKLSATKDGLTAAQTALEAAGFKK